MATIQIREIPDDAYEVMRGRAKAAGQSIQAYMRNQVLDLASRPTKEEAWRAVDSAMAAEDSPGAVMDQVVRDLTEDRR